MKTSHLNQLSLFDVVASAFCDSPDRLRTHEATPSLCPMRASNTHQIQLPGIDAPDGHLALCGQTRSLVRRVRHAAVGLPRRRPTCAAAAQESIGLCDCTTKSVCTRKRGGSYCITATASSFIFADVRSVRLVRMQASAGLGALLRERPQRETRNGSCRAHQPTRQFVAPRWRAY